MSKKPPPQDDSPETMPEEPITAVEPKGEVYDRLTPKLRRGMGHRDAQWSQNAPSARALLGAPHGLPFHARDLEQWVARDLASRIRDQKSTSECVGAATARILHVAVQDQLGVVREVSFPSDREIYTGARELEVGSPDVPLVDEGSRPDLAFVFIGGRGVIPEKLFPFTDDPKEINRRLSAEQLVPAYEFKVTGYHRLDSEGAALIADAKNALAKRNPFAMALQVDQAFEDYSGGDRTIVVPKGKIFGGHYIAIVGYEGSRFRGVNSWGKDWGDGGFFWISEEALAAGRDHTVVTAVPTYDEDSKDRRMEPLTGEGEGA